MPRAIVLLSAVLAVALAGCGGGGGSSSTVKTASKTDYKAKVTQISSSFAQAGQAFAGSVSSKSTPQQAASALETFQTKVRRAAGDLEAITPPADVRDPHNRLVKAFRDVASACQPSIDAGKSGDRTKLRSELVKLRTKLNGSLGNEARNAARDIDAKLSG